MNIRIRRPSLGSYYTRSIVVTLLALLGVTVFSAWSFRSFFVEHLIGGLTTDAWMSAGFLSEERFSAEAKRLVCASRAAELSRRITLIAPDGRVVCDSHAGAAELDNHLHRPEVEEALRGAAAWRIRLSTTVGANLLYVAVPVLVDGTLVAVLRESMRLTTIEQYLTSSSYALAAAGALAMVVVGGTGLYVYLRIKPPLEELRDGALRVARGQFDRPLPAYRVKEIHELGAAMNKMASQLRHLEQVRSDFVANVSHELKTPVTSIKGFVETLVDGAMNNPEDLSRFLEIIRRHSDRLTAIIEDLLTLARLESSHAEGLLVLEEEAVGSFLEAVVEVCRPEAQSKDITLEIDCPTPVTIRIDRSLMEQAVLNLIDNAVKYSHPSTTVRVVVRDEEESVELLVRDEGPGIAPEHLGRLFERFYRADKARSRSVGGTGLGLAIVKHIVQLHRGRVGVDSTVGVGTTFRIELPKHADEPSSSIET